MKGNYALVLHLSRTSEIKVGGLGLHIFNAGYYIYFGSALNSLEGRLRRHVRPQKKLHWHIDYLSSEASLLQIWWATGETRRECSWTQAALNCPGTTAPVLGFGASDCRKCPSHLVCVPSAEHAESVARCIALDTPEALKISYPDFEEFT